MHRSLGPDTGIHVFYDGSNRFEMREADPHPAELATLLVNRKPVIYTQFNATERSRLKSLCLRFNLKMLTVERLPVGMKRGTQRKTAFIGRKISLLQRAKACLARDTTSLLWGSLLGYPECCVRFYAQKRRKAARAIKNEQKAEQEPVRWAVNRSRSRGPYHFYLNNVFNFFSRASLVSAAQDAYNAKAMEIFNFPLNISALHVVPWHPCSYSCGKSRRAAAEIYGFLNRHLPSFAAKLKHYLQRRILFWDKYQFAVLDGGEPAGNGQVFFNGLDKPYSLLFSEDIKNLRNGRKLLNAKGRFWVKGSGKGGWKALSPNAELLDFSLAD